MFTGKGQGLDRLSRIFSSWGRGGRGQEVPILEHRGMATVSLALTMRSECDLPPGYVEIGKMMGMDWVSPLSPPRGPDP